MTPARFGGLTGQPIASQSQAWKVFIRPIPAVEIERGAWCGLVLSFSTDLDPLWLQGSTSGGTVFCVALDPGPLRLSEDIDVDGDALLVVIPLSGALDPDALEAAGEDVSVEADDPDAVYWASDIPADASLWLDEDGDAMVGEGDVRASEGASAAYQESAGCGCASGGGASWGWSAAILALAARQKRRGITLLFRIIHATLFRCTAQIFPTSISSPASLKRPLP